MIDLSTDASAWRRFPASATSVGGALCAPPKPSRLLIALHGCNQTAGDFAVGTRLAQAAAARGWATLFPETDRNAATVALNPFGCWIWWARENQGRSGEPARILALADAACRAVGLPDRAAFVAGLSSGAAMATILGAVWPDRVAAVAAHAGVAFSAAEVDTPVVPPWFRGAGPDGTTLLSFSPLNMFRMKAWARDSLAALSTAGDDAHEDAVKAIAARDGAEGYAPVLVVHGQLDAVVDPRNARQLVLQALQIADLADDGEDDQSVDTRADAKAEVEGGPLHDHTRWDWHDAAGGLAARLIRVKKLGHAWSGGHPAGSYTDPLGPDATAATLDFFAEVQAQGR